MINVDEYRTYHAIDAIEIDKLCDEIERLRKLTVREVEFPVLNGILTEKLLAGARIDYQDYEWHLFANDGNGIAHGKTISKMLENLIWAED
ncbi:MAG TPA: hypothetical protein VIH30_06280 [Aquirhabdus sp.]